MQSKSQQFTQNARDALKDAKLQKALENIETGFIKKRAKAIDAFPGDFQALRSQAKAIKDDVIQHLDQYTQQYQAAVTQLGGHVHFAKDAEEARDIASTICQQHNAKSVIKSKSMVTEEINLNEHLEKKGYSVTETDLGEYILQIRHDTPSHIVAPAIHLLKEDIATAFKETHTDLDTNRSLNQREELLSEARTILRQRFLEADVGITGANFLIADKGYTALVTNEGNADLLQMFCKTQIVITSIEKLVPSFKEAMLLIRLLGRSATGQAITAYTTFSSGPRKPEDLDGPEHYHVILVDNGRSQLIGTEFQDMLRCIRCAACMNHCPVYSSVGGKSYGWVYPGPMGSVLTPSLIGVNQSYDLPTASTFCGRCAEVCPVKIPLPTLMRHYREKACEQRLYSWSSRVSLKLWAFLAKRPKLYQALTSIAMRVMHRFAHKGRFKKLPLAHGWTQYRDFPAPAENTFQQLYQKRQVP